MIAIKYPILGVHHALLVKFIYFMPVLFLLFPSIDRPRNTRGKPRIRID
jgi:hypothetical protein